MPLLVYDNDDDDERLYIIGKYIEHYENNHKLKAVAPRADELIPEIS
jgi:hypothetical protein